ncbi:MAG: hypothetical protein CVU56_01140 [Deltaproteobacteria bacterium HGW-Deltaproteobacteria-14]|jgi:hypothetical protein|nr:MAG: hypothetical protein CVU56_01140 [Deltaproteobacteria bacterium HGW-Deltaproteobacteria-14]
MRWELGPASGEITRSEAATASCRPRGATPRPARATDGIDFTTLTGDDVARALMIGLAASPVGEVRSMEDGAD